MVKRSLGGILERNLCELAEGSSSIDWQSTDQSWILKNLEDTISLGMALIKNLPELRLLLLEGPLGAGKTSLVKGIGKALGITEPITSPTFALAQHYETGKKPLVHLDLYRLEDPESAYSLFQQEEEEANALDALMVIEWPKRLGVDLQEAWLMELQYHQKEERLAHLSPCMSRKEG